MKKVLFFTSIALICVSCVSSLYSVTTNTKDIVFKKELIGSWKDVNGGSQYFVDSVNTPNGKNYKVVIVDYDQNNKPTDTSNFLVMLVNIRGHYFLDCLPDTGAAAYTRLGDLTRSAILPCHYIIKLYSIRGDYISLSAIDKDALSLLLKNKKIDIKHEDIDKDDILLTEQPAILQKKLSELENFPALYKRDSLVRVR